MTGDFEQTEHTEAETGQPATNQRDNGTAAAQRVQVDDTIDALAVEAAVANAVRQRALNYGRVMLMPEDLALQRLVVALMQRPHAMDSRTEIARLTSLRQMAEAR